MYYTVASFVGNGKVLGVLEEVLSITSSKVACIRQVEGYWGCFGGVLGEIFRVVLGEILKGS